MNCRMHAYATDSPRRNTRRSPSAHAHAHARTQSFNTDWMRKWTGRSRLALRPTTTAQVSAILKYCNERRLPVVPQVRWTAACECLPAAGGTCFPALDASGTQQIQL